MVDVFNLIFGALETEVLGSTYLLYVFLALILIVILIAIRVPIFIVVLLPLPLILLLFPNMAIIVGGLMGGIILFWILKSIFFGG